MRIPPFTSPVFVFADSLVYEVGFYIVITLLTELLLRRVRLIVVVVFVTHIIPRSR